MYTAQAAAWVPAEIMVGRTMPIRGAVLELACGTGHWTRIIAGREEVTSVTTLDASPEMIEIAREKVPGATFIEADVFEWVPRRTYDCVFMGFFLSHVPPARFKSFWGMVGAALKPGGTTCFIDSGAGAAATEVVSAPGEVVRSSRRHRLQDRKDVPCPWRAEGDAGSGRVGRA